MNLRVLLDNKEVAIANPGEYNDSFETEFPSPNPRASMKNFIEMSATGDAYDGYKIYQHAIRGRGYQNAISCQMLDILTGEKVFDGFALPYAANSLEDLRRKKVMLEIKEISQTFEELCEGFSLRTLSAGRTATAQTWNSAVTYPPTTLVNYLGKVYQCYFPNGSTNNRPDISPNFWRYIYDLPAPTAFQEAEFKQAYYITNQPENEAFQAFQVSISLYLLTFEFIQFVRSISRTDIGSFITLIPYTIAFVAAGFAMLNELSKIVFDKPRRYWTAPVRAILEKAFQAIGFTLSTSLFDTDYANLCVLGSTDQPGKTGRPGNNPIPDKTLIEFMGDIGAFFNGKFKVTNDKKVIFETVDYFWRPTNPATGQANGARIPDLQDNGVRSTNMDELPRTYKLGYLRDDNDTNTRYETTENNVTVSFELTNILQKQAQGLNREVNIELPYARAIRKKKNTTVERIFNTIYDAFAGFFGFNRDFGGDRRNLMLLSSENIAVPKLMIVDGNGKLSATNEDYVNALYQYNKFHRVSTIFGNQWFKVKNVPGFPLQAKFVRGLKQWNVIKRWDGKNCVVTKNERNMEKQIHSIEYRYQENYINTDLVIERISKD